MSTTTDALPNPYAPIPAAAVTVRIGMRARATSAAQVGSSIRDNKDRDTEVSIDGTQWARDGRVERIISTGDDDLNDQARQLAAALIAAANEVDQMARHRGGDREIVDERVRRLGPDSAGGDSAGGNETCRRAGRVKHGRAVPAAWVGGCARP